MKWVFQNPRRNIYVESFLVNSRTRLYGCFWLFSKRGCSLFLAPVLLLAPIFWVFYLKKFKFIVLFNYCTCVKHTITTACFHLLLLVFLSAGIPDFENLSTWRIELVSSAFCEVFIDIAITISIFISPMTNKFGKQVHLEEFTQMRLIKKKLVMPHVITSRSCDKLKPLYLHY